MTTTTDTTPDNNMGRPDRRTVPAALGLRSRRGSAEQDWADGLKALSGIDTQNDDGWNRKMSATLAYLKHAHDLLHAAETKLARQEERITALENLATTDDLTGLKNRRGFYDGFMRELDCVNRGISKGGLLVMIDLDNFKAVNDTYGHAAGDAVLKLVGRTLGGEIRRMDLAGRLGGDEFVLLLANTNAADAAPRAQKITWQLNNLSMAWNGHIIPVQASTGLKAFAAGDRAEQILNSADGTLYAMKAERKNNTTQRGENKMMK